MAGWEHHRPPRTSSRWQTPGIFINVEFGVSFSPTDRTHTTGIAYTSGRMQERLHQERTRRQHEGAHSYQEPGELQQLATLGALMPGPEVLGEYGDGLEAERQTRHQQQQRQRRLGVRTREQHERGRSAPPSFTDHQPFSPVAVNYIPHIAPIQHTQSMPLKRTDSQSLLLERTNRPLPPTPSQFRLGEEDMPWSMPAWYRSPDQPGFVTPSVTGMDQEHRRTEDPQRVRELETLQQAMMTVDSLDHDEWEPWMWDNVGETPRGPRSIGWAVSSREDRSRSPPVLDPPPYVVSQWEQAYATAYERPRSAYS
jgi:hypothetical protein